MGLLARLNPFSLGGSLTGHDGTLTASEGSPQGHHKGKRAAFRANRYEPPHCPAMPRGNPFLIV